jgi:hypothetical protein
MLPRFQALQITQEQPPHLLDGLSCQRQKALSNRKENFDIAHQNAGLSDGFARRNIINQIGVLVSVFAGIP